MADNVSITAGTGTTVAADEVVDGTLGTVKVQYVKLMDGALDGTTKGTIGANGLKVDGSAVTQPVSIASVPTHAVTQSGTWTVQPGNTANSTAWLVTQAPATSGGLSTYTLISAATTNLNTPKSSAGQIYNIQAFNTNASSVRYLKIYNKASNPTLASDTPIAVYMIPSGGGGVVVEISNGIACSNGIAIAITGAVANNDTTAISASEVVVNIQYK
jgi:hypothetical protein